MHKYLQWQKPEAAFLLISIICSVWDFQPLCQQNSCISVSMCFGLKIGKQHILDWCWNIHHLKYIQYHTSCIMYHIWYIITSYIIHHLITYFSSTKCWSAEEANETPVSRGLQADECGKVVVGHPRPLQAVSHPGEVSRIDIYIIYIYTNTYTYNTQIYIIYR